MKPFDQVTRATQRERLRRLGQVALERYAIHEAKLRFMSDTGTVVFRVDTPSQRYALRIDPELPAPQWLEMLEAEMAWLSALRSDTALAVPEPVASQDGALAQVVATEGLPEGRMVSLLRWIPGRLIGDRPTPDVLAQMGAFMAHLHHHAVSHCWARSPTDALPASVRESGSMGRERGDFQCNTVTLTTLPKST